MYTAKVKQLYGKLNILANKLPLCSKEVVRISQELDVVILKIMQSQLKTKPVNFPEQLYSKQGKKTPKICRPESLSTKIKKQP